MLKLKSKHLSSYQKLKRTQRRQNTAILFIATVTACLFCQVVGYELDAKHHNSIISPVGQAQAIEPAPVTEYQTIDLLEMLDGIHMLESSRGKAKIGLQGYCEAQGLSNEYGYGGMKMKLCFRNHNEARGRVLLWLAEKMEQFNNNPGLTLCYYNLGEKVTDCQYYQDYLSIKGK